MTASRPQEGACATPYWWRVAGVGVAEWRCGGVLRRSDCVAINRHCSFGLGVVVFMEGVYARGEGWRVRVLHVSVRVRARAHRSLCLFVCVANSKAATDVCIRHRFYFVSVSV